MSHTHKILIVDDNQINRQYFSMALKKLGHQVYLAQSGVEAIVLSEQNDFDIILMDIRMPEMNGNEATTKIKQMQRHANTPVIAISAEKCPKSVLTIFDGFLLKPVRPGDLQQTIDGYSQQQTTSVFDKEHALKFSNNDENIMAVLIEMFIKEFPQQITDLEVFINQKSKEKSAAIVHKMRGSAKICGAMAVDKQLEELNKLINSRDAETLKPQLNKLLQQFDHYITEIP